MEDVLNHPLLSLTPKEIPMPWTLTMSTYQNSPPQNVPNVLKKAIAFIVARLATTPPPVIPLAPVTPYLPLLILKTFTTLKLPHHPRKSDEEIFSTLKMCYKKSPEEITSVALTPGILKAWDF